MRVHLVGTDDELHKVVGVHGDVPLEELQQIIYDGFEIQGELSGMKLDARWMSDAGWKFICDSTPPNFLGAGGKEDNSSTSGSSGGVGLNPRGQEGVDNQESNYSPFRRYGPSPVLSYNRFKDIFDDEKIEGRNQAPPATSTAQPGQPAWDGNRHTLITPLSCAHVLDLLKIRKGKHFISVTVNRRGDIQKEGELLPRRVPKRELT